MAANQSALLRTNIDSCDFLYQPETLLALERAAKQFIKHEDSTTKIWAASRDWFMEEWGRDTFISLPGLLLTTERFQEAREVFLHYVAYEKGGLIPNLIREGVFLYNTADASLWFIHALKSYLEATNDRDFINQMLPAVRNIIAGYSAGTSFERTGKTYSVGMDQADSLIMSPPQATWMDADPSGDGSSPVTPRDGKCVEINALWYGSLRFVISAEKALGNDAVDLEQQAERVKVSFQQKFWNEATGCLYDVLGADGNDGSIRPNQIIAISHGEDLLSPDQQRKVMNIVEQKLLTRGGLRTLSSDNPSYQGQYETYQPVYVKDFEYHQGTIWPWLIGPYCDALRILGRSDEIESVIAPLVQFCLDSEFGSLPEVFSGDAPYEPGGTTSQAWSVAEVLRTLKNVQFII